MLASFFVFRGQLLGTKNVTETKLHCKDLIRNSFSALSCLGDHLHKAVREHILHFPESKDTLLSRCAKQMLCFLWVALTHLPFLPNKQK